MQTHRKNLRGSAAAVIGIILVIVVAAAIFLFRKTDLPGVSGTSALDMAKLIPADSQAAWVWSLNGQLDYVGWVNDFKELHAKFEEKDQQDFKDFEKKLGMPLEEWLALFDGRGFFALSAGKTPQEPGFIGSVGLAKSAEFGTWWQNQAKSYNESITEHDIDGVKFVTIGSEPPFVGYDKTWLYLADSQENAKKLMNSAKGGAQGLDTAPLFQDALKQVDTKGSGALMFADVSQVLKQMQAAKLPGTDEKTYTELAAFQYGIVSVDFANSTIDGFTKVSGESDLAEEMLKQGGLSAASLDGISGKVTNASSIDVKWMINVFIKAAMVAPESRPQAAMAGFGLMSQGDPWAAFNGDVTIAGDTMAVLADTLTENFSKAKGQGQLTACKSNLKNLGTAMEMYSTDWSGKYPTKVALLTPNYLRTFPECPAAGKDSYTASLQMGPNAPGNDQHYQDYYQFECQGDNHPEIGANHPKYNGIVGLVERSGLPSTPEAADEKKEPTPPSTVAVARLANAAAAHTLLNKLAPIGGEAPAQGAEQDYALPVPGASFKLSNKEKPLAVLNYGPNADALLDLSSGNLAEKSPVKDLLSWSPTGIVYIDYLDLQPAYDALVKNLKASDSDEAKTGLAAVEMIRARLTRMDGASCITVKETGIHYRSVGVSGVSMLGIGSAVLIPNFIRARVQGQFLACRSNLKNIGTGLEMYATDYSGKYPKNVAMLTPNYLKTIPSCPSAGRDSYSESYKVTPPAKAGEWEGYHINCIGANHEGVSVPPNFPAYNSTQGLVERP